MNWQPLAAFAVPGVAGVLLWLLPLPVGLMRRIGLGFAAVQLAIALVMVRAAAGGEVLVHGFGNWAPPFGIVFVADRLAALFVALLALLLLIAIWALRPSLHGGDTVGRSLPLLFLVAFGLTGAFLTGDLFNLFVMFEVVLLASYLLLQIPGGGRSLRAAFPNVAINLVASLLFFVAVGLIYGMTGTVNLGDLADRIGAAPAGLRLAALSMLTLAFGIKAALIPFLYWLPATYPTLSGPVAALFAGMMTKLGVYALLRTAPLLMQDTPLPTVLVWVGGASAILAVLAALSEYELRRLLGFHITSQVGYMVLGLGLMTRAAIAGAVFYLVHHVLVKTALFLVSDELERRSGTRDLRRMTAASPGGGDTMLAVAFVIAAFSLAGLPPFSGFFAKVGLFRGAFESAEWGVLAVLVVASFYTLASMLKIWRFAFRPASESAGPASAARPSWTRLAPILGIVAVSVALAAAAGPVFRYAEATAEQILDVSAYAAAVRGTPGMGSPTGGGTP